MSPETLFVAFGSVVFGLWVLRICLLLAIWSVDRLSGLRSRDADLKREADEIARMAPGPEKTERRHQWVEDVARRVGGRK